MNFVVDFTIDLIKGFILFSIVLYLLFGINNVNGLKKLCTKNRDLEN